MNLFGNPISNVCDNDCVILLKINGLDELFILYL